MTQLPTTPAVEGIYIGQQLDPSHAGYWTAECAELIGPVDVPRLAEAIDATVAQAQVLHTRYPAADRVQLGDPAGWRCRIVAADSWSDVESEVTRRLSVPGDLARGGLFDTVLFTGPDRVWWYLQAHHIVLDGFGYALLYRQVSQRYRGTKVRPFGSLADLSHHEESYRDSCEAAEHRQWWIDHLDSQIATTFSATGALPGRTPHRVTLDPGEATAAATWPHRLLAAVAAALHDRTGTPRPLLGLPVAGRLGGPAGTVPGMVMNISPLAVDIGLDDDVEAVAATVEQQLRLTRPRQRYRHEWLRNDLGLAPGERLFGPVVNIVPFSDPPQLPDCEVRIHHLAAGPVDDVSVTARGPEHITVEANPNVYSLAELEDVRDAIAARLLGGGRVARWHPIASPPPRPHNTLPEAMSRNANSDDVAIADADRLLSYRELAARVHTVAGGLAASGVAEGDVVAIALPRGIEAIVAMLAVLHLGATYLPIDPSGAAERNRAILDEAKPALIIDGALPEAEPRRKAVWPPETAAYLMYTSGTTGRPKGVEVPRRALDFFTSTAARRYGFGRDDRVLQFAPLHFDTHVEEVYATFQAGATVVIRDGSATDSLPRFARFLADHDVTVLDLPTAYWHELALALSEGLVRLPESLRTVIIGGEAVDEVRVRQWHDAAGDRIRLINTYGPTEATVVCLAADLRPGELPGLGGPLPGVHAAVGPRDELYIAGPGLASYRGTEAASGFVTVDGQAWYRTGDIVRPRPDGTLDYAGRVDAQLKISGHRVQPVEVETAVMTHPQVREVAITAATSGSQTIMTAHVVTSGEVGDAELAAAAGRRLAAAAVPARFIRHDRLPRTATGKIDRSALPAAPAPETGIAPSGTMERAVCDVFEAVLGTPVRSVTDDFFACGGTSMTAVAAATRLSARLRREVTAAQLFTNPTVAGLAAVLSGETVDDADPHESIAADRIWHPPAIETDAADGTIVLTGATGFVGSHLLAALRTRTDAPLRLLTRGDADRVASCAAAFGLPAPDLTRIEVVQCDLSRPDLGLPAREHRRLSRASAIVNCAADVGFSRGYRGLRAGNVEAVRALLDTGTRLHQISTVAVGAGESLPESWVTARAGLTDGYQTTKWVAEELLRQAEAAGRAVACHRLGRVVPGAAAANPRDLVMLCAQAGIEVNALPDLDFSEPWMTAPDTAECLARMVVEGRTGVWNLVSGPPVRLTTVWEAMRQFGVALEVVSAQRWAQLLEEHPDADRLGVLRAFIAAHGDTRVAADIHNARFIEWLRANDMSAPTVDVLGVCAALAPTATLPN